MDHRTARKTWSAGRGGFGEADNVYLENGAVINVLDPLDGLIGVSGAADRNTAYTSGLRGKGTTDNFLADDSFFDFPYPTSIIVLP